MLGERQPEIYGTEILQDIKSLCEAKAAEFGVTVDFRQSNHEGDIIDWIQEAGRAGSDIILNPGAFGHTSIAIMDAILGVKVNVIEVHLSNIYKREEFRHKTYSARAVKAVISGLGNFGYLSAIQALALTEN